MKTRIAFFIVTVFVISAPLRADLSVEDIERMVERIHLKRPGVSLEKLEQTKEPFVVIQKESTDNNASEVKIVLSKEIKEDDTEFTLHALMNGKAFINNAWRKKGDTVLGYTVVYIGKRGVVLRKGNRIKTLFLPKKNNNLIKLDERA